ncbi:MAG: DsrE/DsrF/DrsH-like family protein [Pirellulaceae bacterium]
METQNLVGEVAPVEILQRLQTLEDRIAQLGDNSVSEVPDPNGLSLLVFDSHLDRLLAAFVIATGAAASGMTVSMFFTFWATAALRKGTGQGKKTLVERAFGWMLPHSALGTKLSRMDMCGLGRTLMQREMSRKNIASLPELMKTAGELGVQINVCEMSMKLMGIHRDELIDYPNLNYRGVASFVETTANVNTTLFI